jgi:hypothetical protein
MIQVALAILTSCATAVFAQQTAAPAAASGRAIGTITAVNGNTITMKTDSGSQTQVVVPESARIVKTAPGQKDLKGATGIQLQDIQVGDRALVRGTPGDGNNTITATSVIVMKQTDVAGRQQQEIQDWQRRGTGGIVRSVDAASGSIAVGAGPNQTTTIQTGPDTQFLRYAPDSVKFSDATKSIIADIKPGDQLRARGNRSADGQQFAAEAVISGSFRNVAGTVNAVDTAANTITVMDLIAKRPTVVKISADTQMRKIPAEMAQRIAMFLRRPAGGGAAGDHSATSAPAGAQAVREGAGARGGPGGQGGPPDFQRMIRAMPAAAIGDLQKGDAVMIVTTEGASGQQVTALTLLSGVEPILTAAPTQTTAANLLSGWSVGGGEGEAQ